MSRALATWRTGNKGSLEIWYDTETHQWTMFAFVRHNFESTRYMIELTDIEQRHTIGNLICGEGKVPDDAIKVDVPPTTALMFEHRIFTP